MSVKHILSYNPPPQKFAGDTQKKEVKRKMFNREFDREGINEKDLFYWTERTEDGKNILKIPTRHAGTCEIYLKKPTFVINVFPLSHVVSNFYLRGYKRPTDLEMLFLLKFKEEIEKAEKELCSGLLVILNCGTILVVGCKHIRSYTYPHFIVIHDPSLNVVI